MNDPLVFPFVAALAGLLAFLMLGFALIERRRANSAETRALNATRDLAAAQERARNFEDSAAGMREVFQAASAQTLEGVTDALLKRAEEAFVSRDRLAHERLAGQLKPMADTLEKFAAHVTEVENKRLADTVGLKGQIEQLLNASTATQEEARKLSSALKRGAGIQGRWGEQMLRNVLELAGLRPGIDFEEQVHVEGEEGARRPDVIVRLPGGGIFVIDSKVSLNDYLLSVEAIDDVAREAALKGHLESVRRHVTQLSSKAYWLQFDKPPKSRSPDIVAMFVPLESALACIAERHPTLVAEAWEKRVAIVTPTALFPLLRAVAYGWRAEDQAANAREIADAGRELHKRVSVIAKYALDLGGALDKAVERYNDFTTSLERNVLTQARRFEGLKAQSDRTIAEVPMIEGRSKPLTKLSTEESAALTAPDAAPTS
jgi:DNA recombination protein RmuC